MQKVRHNPIAAALASRHLAQRRTTARKGKGSYRRHDKHRKALA
jgi:stalled ribosome alternative rescue factor ArfA